MPGFAPNVVRRLTLARYQMARARLQLVNATEFSAWQAAIALHDAADIAVLALADQLGVPRKKRRYLHEFPELIENAAKKPFFDRPLIEEDLSEVRNPAKHRGGFPGVTDVGGLAERTRECLERNCSTYLGQPLSAFSLADMIDDTDIRTIVKEAESLIGASRFTEAQAALKHAWTEIMERTGSRVPGPELPAFPLRQYRVPRELEEYVRDVEDWRSVVQSKLELLLLGVDPIRHAVFEALGPITHVFGDGRREYYRGVEDAVIHTAETADFSLLFVIDTVIRLQDIGRVRRPHSRYAVRIAKNCKYFDARATDAPAGELSEGTLIEGAHVGRGFWREDEGAWFWDDDATGRTYLIRLSDAELQDWTTGEEYHRRQIRLSRQRKSGEAGAES